MYGFMYRALSGPQSVSVAQGLIELQAPATGVLVIHRVLVTQEGDEVSQQLPVELVRGEGTVASGSGGAAATIVKGMKFAPTFTGGAERNNTTRLAAGSGALVTLEREGYNVLNGYDYRPTPEERDIISPSDFFEVGWVTAPSSALVVSAIVWCEFIGG